MSVEEYLSTLKDQIRDKNAKDMVAAEYLCHIEDQATAFQNPQSPIPNPHENINNYILSYKQRI